MKFKTKILAVLTATVLAGTIEIAAQESPAQVRRMDAAIAGEPSDQVKRMDAAATVLNEIMGTRDKGIPQRLLDSAKCIAVIPSMFKIGFVYGGRHGR